MKNQIRQEIKAAKQGLREARKSGTPEDMEKAASILEELEEEISILLRR